MSSGETLYSKKSKDSINKSYTVEDLRVACNILGFCTKGDKPSLFKRVMTLEALANTEGLDDKQISYNIEIVQYSMDNIIHNLMGKDRDTIDRMIRVYSYLYGIREILMSNHKDAYSMYEDRIKRYGKIMPKSRTYESNDLMTYIDNPFAKKGRRRGSTLFHDKSHTT